MKHTAISAALAFALGAQNAMAAGEAITITKMDFYPPGATTPSFTDPSVSGSVNASGTGSFNSGVPFFGVAWTADQQVWFDNTTAGAITLTWSGTSASGAYNYSFTLQPGQVALGVYFTWSVNTDIPVLVVFDCGAGNVGDTCVPVDADVDGAPGVAMQTPPFPGQTPAFSGVVKTTGPAFGGGGAISNCSHPVCDTSGAAIPSSAMDSNNDGYVSLSELVSAGIPQDEKAFQMCVGGCFDFSVNGVAGSTTITLSLNAPIPAAAAYRKWDGSKWVDFDTSTGDTIASAFKQGGVCPGLSNQYASGLLKGRECIRLTIQDNGPNDSSPVVGTVSDPGGIIEVEQPDPETSLGKAFGSIGGAGCVLADREQDPRLHLEWLLLASGCLWLGVRKRMKKQ